MPKPKDDVIVLDGVAKEALPNAMFRVELDNGHEVLAHISGKMRRSRIRVLPGDRVKLSMYPFSIKNTSMPYRYK